MLELSRGVHFNFSITLMGRRVSDKSAAEGFLVQRGRFLVVKKIMYLELVLNTWILATCIWILAEF